MDWILEDPLYTLVLGIVVITCLGFGWLQTRFRPLAYATGGAVVITILLLVLEWLVVTDFERVEAALHGMAEDVEQNNLAAILRHIHPEARHVRIRAEHEFPRYRFSRVSVKRNLEVEFDELDRTRAVARFNVVVVGEETTYGSRFHQPQFVELKLRQENDRWQVADYRHWPPQRGLLTAPPSLDY